ncbi:hypothetical protein ABZ136_38110, partial [Streptomyces microflavus]
MTIPRRSWRGAGALVAAAVVGLTGGVISAGPAAATLTDRRVEEVLRLARSHTAALSAVATLRRRF